MTIKRVGDVIAYVLSQGQLLLALADYFYVIQKLMPYRTWNPKHFGGKDAQSLNSASRSHVQKVTKVTKSTSLSMCLFADTLL